VDGAITHSVDARAIFEDDIGSFLKNYQPDWIINMDRLNFHPFEVGFKDEGRSYANITSKKGEFVWANWLGGKASVYSTTYHVF
jgi:hypothetical protein